MNETKTGVVEGTGAVINVSLGWIPNYVRVVNTEDGDTIDEWFRGMAAGTSVTAATGVSTRATNGITAYEGDATHPKGFTIGSGISESGKSLMWFAQRSGPGSQN